MTTTFIVSPPQIKEIAKNHDIDYNYLRNLNKLGVLDQSALRDLCILADYKKLKEHQTKTKIVAALAQAYNTSTNKVFQIINEEIPKYKCKKCGKEIGRRAFYGSQICRECKMKTREPYSYEKIITAYKQAKATYGESTLILFHVKDQYEAYFDDAIIIGALVPRYKMQTYESTFGAIQYISFPATASNLDKLKTVDFATINYHGPVTYELSTKPITVYNDNDKIYAYGTNAELLDILFDVQYGDTPRTQQISKGLFPEDENNNIIPMAEFSEEDLKSMCQILECHDIKIIQVNI